MYNKKPVRKKIYIKNMINDCCIRSLKRDFEDNDIKVITIKPGFAEIEYDSEKNDNQKISDILLLSGLSLLKTNEEKIAEQIKIAVQELIFEMNNVDSIVKKSEYIVEKLGYNYRYLSRLFSENEHITLEKYIIEKKIERIKQMVVEDEYSLSEIAYMMDYSSVQYLSSQFKKETGMTVSEFKEKYLSDR